MTSYFYFLNIIIIIEKKNRFETIFTKHILINKIIRIINDYKMHQEL